MRWRRDRDGDEPQAETPSEAETGVAPGGPAATHGGRPRVPVELGRVGTEQLRTAARRVVARALTEDLAGGTDVTSAATVPIGTTGRALLVAREAGVVAGLDLVFEVCRQVDHRLEVKLTAFDGDSVRRGTVVAELTGPLRTLLTAERTLLNLVCQLSGVATRTREFADLLDGTGCVVRDTRKTTPGLRLLEKHAVAVGGGANHRVGLHDALLVKDNHVAAAGGVGPAARAALDGAPAGMHVQVEVTSLTEAEAALAEGVTDLLLDNFTPDQVREAVAQIAGRAAVEASGGITLETARAYAEAGADRLAVGALTHSAPSLDLALDVTDVTAPRRVALGAPAPARSAPSVAAADDSAVETVAEPSPAVDDAATGSWSEAGTAVDDATAAAPVVGQPEEATPDDQADDQPEDQPEDQAVDDEGAGPTWLDGDFTTEH